MLKWFLETGKETLLTLEDDVAFLHFEKFQQVTQELPKDWQMLYLGANAKPYAEFDPAVYYSEHLRIIKSAFCTHAVGYKRELVQEIVDTYEYKGGQLYDTWLDIHILKTRPVYIAVPMLAIQKGSRSDLWDRNVDYGDIFQASNDYLKSIK
jgi:GR25 family glycosyltransferase involved in LPS biosynthesis